MITKTVHIQEIIKVGDPFAVEMLPSAVTGHPYMGQPSPIAIFNDTGSGKKVRVKLLNLRPLSATNALTSIIAVQKVSGYTGGTSLVPFKFDSTNTNLPSQVVCNIDPATVTLTAGTELRRSMTLSEQNPTRALASLCSCGNGDARSGMDSGEFIRLTGDTDVTGYILREGQGLAIVYKANSPSHGYAINIRMKNFSTGHCYRFDHILEPKYMADQTPLVLFNGSGSGIVLEVEKVQIREIGTDEIVLADYSIIDGIMGAERDGSTPCYIMSDSTDSLPTGLIIKKNCVTARAGYKIGALITLPAQRRMVLAEAPYGVGISGGAQVARRGMFSPDLLNSDILLEEGTGIGLFLRNGGSQVFYEFTAILNVEIPETPTGGGATCFAF